jgi:hypothetical protein
MEFIVEIKKDVKHTCQIQVYMSNFIWDENICQEKGCLIDGISRSKLEVCEAAVDWI